MFFTVPWVDSRMPVLLVSLLLLISLQRLVRGGKHCYLFEMVKLLIPLKEPFFPFFFFI